MKRILLFLSICFLFIFKLLTVQAETDLKKIEDWEIDCQSSDKIQIEAHFAPVIKLTENERQNNKDKWGYKYTNKERSYPDNRILISEGGPKEIYFVTTINKADIKTAPTYVWHVIAIPRLKNPEKPYDALWAESYRVKDSFIKPNEIQQLKKLSRVGDDPAYNLASVTSERARVNQMWRQIFGDEVIRELVIQSAWNREELGITSDSYDYTFYFAPVPSLDQINPEGFRWVSSRKVTRSGNAFGFVINAKGECIASAKLQIAPEN